LFSKETSDAANNQAFLAQCQENIYIFLVGFWVAVMRLAHKTLPVGETCASANVFLAATP